jgi:hypothetical protein
MEMVKLAWLGIFCLSPLVASPFSLIIGNPIAASVPRMKTAQLAVRLENCVDLSKSTLTGTGEGARGGVRKSVPLEIMAGAVPGVYALGLGSPLDGPWVAVLKATCGSVSAGAIVPFRGAVFDRQSVQFFPRFATEAEVEASLKKHSGGTK